jgi:hypothetical protein
VGRVGFRRVALFAGLRAALARSAAANSFSTFVADLLASVLPAAFATLGLVGIALSFLRSATGRRSGRLNGTPHYERMFAKLPFR